MIPRLLIVNDAHEPFGRHRMLPHPIDEAIPFRFILFFLALPLVQGCAGQLVKQLAHCSYELAHG